MKCCKITPRKKVKKRKQVKGCGDADNRAKHLNLLNVEPEKVVNGVEIYRI